MKKITGKIIDVKNQKIFNAEVFINGSKIQKINQVSEEFSNYIIPGLIDAHVHIESSMLIPSRFAYFAVKNGVVAVVTDPHEIANVLGIKGIDFMIEDSKKVPVKFYFGASSCVPATSFETSGAVLGVEEIKKLLYRDDIYFLSEMMNFPGVIYKDPQVWAKINCAKKIGKPIDGHAPGLRGDDLKKYVEAGISTDHEAYTYEEAEEKIKLGMKIQIREGSAAKNFEALYKLIDNYPDSVMLCTDDSHPDDLAKGYINKLVKKALDKGLDLFNVLRAATLNPIEHYNLDVGLLQEGDPADFIVIDSLENFEILQTYVNGTLVYDKGKVLFDLPELPEPPNKFVADYITPLDISVAKKTNKINVIQAIEGELITKKLVVELNDNNEFVYPNIDDDILKIVVINRYVSSEPSIGFIKGFELKKGAIASSVAHDSHNIIAIGTSDDEIVKVVNHLIDLKGGLVVSDGEKILSLPLEVAGLMSSTDNPLDVAKKYEELNEFSKTLGTKMRAPFMTLSFMALLVIPELKIGDKGLFDVSKFDFVDLFV